MVSRHFRQRCKQRLGHKQGNRFLAMLTHALKQGNMPTDGRYCAEGIGTVIIKKGTFVTLLGPDMVTA